MMARGLLVTAGLLLTIGATGLVPARAGAESGPITFNVDALNDVVDAYPGDGICRTAAGTCTLRAAIQESDASPWTAHAVVLPAGRVDLSIPTRWAFPSQTLDLKTDPSYGELNVFGRVTITGVGANRSIIDVNGIDRGFSVAPTGALTLSGVTVTGGDALVNDHTPWDIADGGAVLNFGRLTLDGAALTNNRADAGGGAFNTPLSQLDVRNSLIARNNAVEGGGLRIDDGATLVNTTITGNSLFPKPFDAYFPDELTGYGGGIDHRGTGQVRIVSSTITDNTAFKGGAGYNTAQGYLPLPALTQIWPFRTTLLDTVLAGNTVNGTLANCHRSAMVIASLGHNASSDRSCSLARPGDVVAPDLRLGSLADNGGPTLTELPLAGSELIDAGPSAGCPSTDQRGITRPQGSRCDIGAVEVVPPSPRAPSRHHHRNHRGLSTTCGAIACTSRGH